MVGGCNSLRRKSPEFWTILHNNEQIYYNTYPRWVGIHW